MPTLPRRQKPASANATITAVPGVKVGHDTLSARATGCTAILVEGGAVAGVSIRGAAPATHETDLLDPRRSALAIHGIALSGGSAFGLAAAGGLLRFLEERQIGFSFGGSRVPIVPGASIFDLNVGDGRIRPDAECGYRAARAASSDPVLEGSVGAGAGATIGKIRGLGRAMKGGVGSSAIVMPDGLIVAALVVVNAFGDIIDAASGAVVGGVRDVDGRALADARTIMRTTGYQRIASPHNSTIGAVATNAQLTKAQASLVATMGDDGLARSVWPVHSPVDGDVLFALATGSKPGDPDLVTIGSLAADVVSAAIVRAVTRASGLPDFPAVRDLGRSIRRPRRRPQR
jgi:L-aminopeptidase/D-esterase-like protein